MSTFFNIRKKINLISYHLCGRRPWSRGYGEYRQREIERYIAQGCFSKNGLRDGYGFRLDERIIEYPWLFSRLPAEGGLLWDAGSVLNHEFLLRQSKLIGKKIFISTLAPEQLSFPELGVSYLYEDLRQSVLRDECMDWIVSLSTIEHVGMDNTRLYTSDTAKREADRDSYKLAITEFRRIVRPGGKLFLSVPFGKDADHGWFQVFDSARLDSLIDSFSPTSKKEWIFLYKKEGWRYSSRGDAQNATYFDIHLGKGFDPDFAAASRSVACLELTA